MPQTRLNLAPGHWVQARDGDPDAFDIFRRHYSYRKGRPVGTKKISGPGYYMLLMTSAVDALFVWRKFISADGQKGINCAVFRNESGIRSSELILEAERLAWARWPGERLFTYVNAKKVQSSNPGYCFKMAGWSVCGVTKKKRLIILEKIPAALRA